MELKEIFDMMVEHDASDAFIKAGSPIHMRIYTEIRVVKERGPDKKEMAGLVSGITDEQCKNDLKTRKNCEFARCLDGKWRFRIVIFMEKDNYVMAVRKVNLQALSFEELNLPVTLLENLCRERRGMVLVTGITGSGKSTTIAAMLEYINKNVSKHILTIEEP
ncbi:MAG: ATPase, T2SS/T4P/T4SS family, partial [Candidatus Omnitrophica bacterium]|nr:ATPase, T2SS/T4P/T4SS family [Candidatus Omnitrophota bacterium]